jgi:hypothetical protein
MKKLITMLLAMGLLALLSLGGVAYADEDGKNANDNNGKKDHKKVVICHKKDHEFKLVAVKKEELEKHLEDDAFFPKAKVIEEDEDKATVKFVCDNNGDNGNNNGDNGNNNGDDKDDHVKVLVCHEKDHEFKLVAVKKEELKKQLEDDAFFPKAKVIEEDEDKATVKFVCDNNGDNGNNNGDNGDNNGDDKDDKKTIYPFQDDNDDNGDDNGHQAAAIGMRQTALVV